jgi:hypothetical protein
MPNGTIRNNSCEAWFQLPILAQANVCMHGRKDHLRKR